MSQFPFYGGGDAIPGMNTALEGVENQVWWGRWEQQVWLGEAISGAARDAGNTVTDVLRAGLLLGRITASGLLKEWNPTGTDGSEVIFGVLNKNLKMTTGGGNVDRYSGQVLVGGNLYSDRLIIPGNAAESIVADALEYAVLNQLLGRFRLDKHIQYDASRSYKPRFMTAAEVAADAVTVLESDHGRTFNFAAADAATAVTVPAAKIGLMFHFVNPVSQTITIAPASGHIGLPGSMSDDSDALTVGEAGTLIGTAAGQYMAIATVEATD
jgi:hypothetical protein